MIFPGILKREPVTGIFHPDSSAMPSRESSRPDPERQRLLRACAVREAPSLDAFERAVRLASEALDVPVAAIGLLDANEVHYGAAVGTEATRCPADASLCRAIVEADSVHRRSGLASDDRFEGHPVLSDRPALTVAVGIPIVVDGPESITSPPTSIGALYVVDSENRSFGTTEAQILRDLVAPVETTLEHRAHSRAEPSILKQAVHNTTEAVMIVETAGSPPTPRIEYVNDAFTEVMGYAPETALGAPPTLLEGPATNPNVLRPLFEADAEATPFTAETASYRADGEALLIEWNLSPVHTEDASVGHWIAVLHNVTERRRMEETLRERERKVQALYAETGDLLQASRPKEVAARVEALVLDTLGYPLNAVRFVEDDALVPVRVSAAIEAHMPDRPAYPVDGESVVAETFRRGETRIYEDIREVVDDDYDRGRARATAYVPIGSYGLISVASLDSADLDPFDIRLLEILTQNAAVVLDRIERETRQRRSIERIDTLREMSQSILSASSAEAVAQATLQRLAALVPYRRASVVTFDREADTVRLLAADDPGDSPPDLGNALSLDHFRRADGALIRSTRYVKQIPDAATGPVKDHLQAIGVQSYLHAPLRAEDTVIGALNLGAAAPAAYEEEHRDIAREVADMLAVALRQARYRQQLIEAKEEAEEMNRLKSTFLANMSHEIRTPLTSIIGFADLLSDYELGEADRFASLIEKSGTQLLETIDSVLDLSKLESGSVRPAFEPTDVSGQAREAAELIRTRAEDAGIAFHLSVPNTPIQAELDPGALRRILQNLLSNAVKFTDAGGSVSLRVHRDGAHVVLEVEDTGVGIDAAFMPNLFDAFEQEDSGPADDGGGTGLGLAVTKRLVDLLGGTIEVESTKGEGTCFTVRLPRYPDSAP